jgi:hypothetical protein
MDPTRRQAIAAACGATVVAVTTTATVSGHSVVMPRLGDRVRLDGIVSDEAAIQSCHIQVSGFAELEYDEETRRWRLARLLPAPPEVE